MMNSAEMERLHDGIFQFHRDLGIYTTQTTPLLLQNDPMPHYNLMIQLLSSIIFFYTFLESVIRKLLVLLV